MEMIVGMLGALIGVGLFVCGFYFGKNLNTPVETNRTEEEEKKLEEERRIFVEDQKAFKDLLNYNVNTAYGIQSNPFEV